MQSKNLLENMRYDENRFVMDLVHESENFKVVTFTFRAGQELPIHQHNIEGELSIVVLEGEGEFLGAEGAVLAAPRGAVLIAEIREPHGIRAITDMKVLVTIAPPI
ncbi:cupin [Oleidesulfovibrio sp.]|uniref:cupin n=1 Tax=Oleidesulfovibrio sp. TaxID=2909707 RepID=UPI003A8B5918